MGRRSQAPRKPNPIRRGLIMSIVLIACILTGWTISRPIIKTLRSFT